MTRQAGEQIAAQEATERALGQIQEGRRAIAQSGEPQPGSVPQGQQGTDSPASSPGEGQPGEGQTGAGSGEGEGTTTQGTPGSPQGPMTPNQPGKEGETPYDPVYVPDRLGEGEGEQVQVPGQEQGGRPGRETDRPVQEGQSLVPYDQVYTDYQAQAASALENSYIPRGMKDYVRAYFSSLDPGGERP